MFRLFLRTTNFLLSFVVLVFLCIAGAYAGYALWDNSQIYAAAENVQADMMKLKPKTDEAQQGPTFEQLQAINPDVCAWVTLDNTKIDHPVLQGQDNMSYINTDVYGNFALAGSIFLDSRNDNAFGDTFSLLYGHHMENSGMFGDLDLYKDRQFFLDNTSGLLILPDSSYDLEIFACLVVEASDNMIFDPTRWQADISNLLSYTKENAMYFRQETLDMLAKEDCPHILAFSTCSAEFTDARTVVLARMENHLSGIQEGS